MSEEKCPLCECECHYDDASFQFTCKNCGIFRIYQYLIDDLQGNPKEYAIFKSKAKFVAAERKLKGKEFQEYYIHSEPPEKTAKTACNIKAINWEDFINEFPKPHEMSDRVLLNLGRASKKYGEDLIISNIKYEIPTIDCCVLFTDSPNDARNILNDLEGNGFIYQKPTGRDPANKQETLDVTLTITAKGWQKINELQNNNPDSTQIFVAMSFEKTQDEIWEKGIKLGIEGEKETSGKELIPITGHRAVRIDKEHHNNIICDEIIAQIRKSRALVADFTLQNNGVYFEAGFALGLGIPVVWIVKKEDLKNLHFDTRQYNHIVYENADELKKALNNRIRATGI